MSTPTRLSNEELWHSVYSARGRERAALKDLLEYLLEVERRDLHLARGFSSLWAFLTEGLGYEPASAHRRLQALRAAKAVPEIKEHVASGVLSLSVVAAGQGLVQALTKKREVTSQEKRELFASLHSMTKAQAENTVLKKAEAENIQIKGLTERPDQVRALNSTRSEIRFSAGPQFEKKLARLRTLYFHKNPNASIEELLYWAMTEALKTLDPQERQARREARVKPDATARTSAAEPISAHSGTAAEPQIPSAVPLRKDRDAALAQAGHRCEHFDAVTKRRCTETHGLQLDHRFPKSWGGENAPSNYQILCGAHNRWKGSEPPPIPTYAFAQKFRGSSVR